MSTKKYVDGGKLEILWVYGLVT